MHHFRIILFCLLWPFCTVDTMASSMKGDVNDDEVVDVADAMLVVGHILHLENARDINFANADVNSDGIIDVADVMLIIKIILKEDVDIDDPTPPTDGGDAIPGYPVLAPRHP